MANNKKIYTIEIDGLEESIANITELTKEQEELKKELEDLEKGTDEYTLSQIALKRNTKELNEALSDSAKETDDLTDSLGKNEKALAENTDETKDLNESTDSLNSLMDDFGGDTMNQLRGGLDSAKKGMNNFKNSFKGFKGILKGTGLFLLIGLLTSLGTFFTKSILGARKLEKILGTLSAAFGVLLGDLIKVGSFLSSIKFDTNEWGIPTLTAETGLLTGAFQDLGDRISKNIKQTNELIDAQHVLRDSTRGVQLNIAELAKQQEILQAIADDDTRSLREQAEASQKVAEVAGKRLTEQIKLSQTRLDLANKELAIAREQGQESDDLLDAQLEAQLELIESEKELSVFRLENRQKTNKILRDSFEQDLDFAIDLADKEKIINEQKIASDKSTFEERDILFKRTVELTNEAFEEQIRLVEEFTGKSIDFNALIAIDDQKRVLNKLKEAELDEITTKRALEIIKERKQALQDLAVVEQEILEKKVDRSKLEDKAEQDLLTFRIERRIRSEKDLEKRIEAEKELIFLKNAIILENEKLTANDKIRIKEEENEQILALDQKLADEQEKKRKEQEEARKEQFNQTVEAAKQFIGAALEFVDTIFEESLAKREALLEESKERVDLADQNLEASRLRAEEINEQLKESTGQRREFLIKEARKEEKAEKRLDREKEKAVKNELKRSKELESEKKRQSDINKKIAISEAVIAGGLAIVQVLATKTALIDPAASVFRAVQIGLVAATTALQVATIQKQTFSKGDIIKGKSHAEGGVRFTVGGVGGFEAEGGEAIINKKSTSMFRGLLSDINVAGGGKSFAEGGLPSVDFGSVTQALQTDNTSSKLDLLIEETKLINSAPIYTVATEVADVNSRVANIEEKATLSS